MGNMERSWGAEHRSQENIVAFKMEETENKQIEKIY